MSASGRASDFMRAWGEGHNKPHNPGHKAWGADDCDACTAEAFDPWEALVHAARIAGFLRDEQAGYGDIVEAARRDALGEAADRISRLVAPRDADWHEALFRAVCVMDDLLRGHAIDATAPPRVPTVSVSDQGADRRIPGTPGAVSGHSGPREEDAETFTVSEIRAAFAAASPDDWGVPCHYETTMLLALRGER